MSGVVDADEGTAEGQAVDVAMERVEATDREHVRDRTDIVRTVCGAAIGLAGTWLARRPEVGIFEIDLFRLPNHVTGVVLPIVYVVMQAGQFLAVPASAAVAWFTGRRRLAFDLAIVGVGAWLAMQGFKLLIERGRPAELLADVIVRGSPQAGLGFPSGHSGVAAALATVAGPWLPRRWRRVTWVVVAVVGFSRLYIGAHLPYDVVAGAALGWMTGAAVLFVRGAPRHRPDAAFVSDALTSLGFHVSTCVPLRSRGRRTTPFAVTVADGEPLFVRIAGVQQRDADLLARLWRWIVRDDPEDADPLTTPGHATDHEATATLLAARAGIRVPSVVGATVTPDGSGVLVEAFIDGTAADRLPPGSVDDRMLRVMWGQLRDLHARRIAHGDLGPGNWIVADDGAVTLTGLRYATVGAGDAALRRDVAELLAATAAVAGARRAVAAAVDVLDATTVGGALVQLQPLALSGPIRRALRATCGFEALRTAVVEATAVPGPPSLAPVTTDRRTVIGIAIVGITVFGFLPQVGAFDRTLAVLTTPEWAFIAAAAALAGLQYVGGAVALRAAAQVPLPLGSTTLTQIADPAVEALADAPAREASTRARLTERAGATRDAAKRTADVDRLAGLVVNVVLLAAAAVLAGSELTRNVRDVPADAALLAVPVLPAVATGLLLRVPQRHLRRSLRALRAWRDLRHVSTDPLRAALLFGGRATRTATVLLVLFMSVRAFSPIVGFGRIALACLLAAAISALVPTPAGVGVVDATLVLGLVAVGIAAAPAVAGVLAHRLVTFWLPLAPGIRAAGRLQHAGVL
ncbi:MAG TPA: phosphatase PAP2 family protein [Euzebyales bacterium]